MKNLFRERVFGSMVLDEDRWVWVYVLPCPTNV